jgi:hypothetical protein
MTGKTCHSAGKELAVGRSLTQTANAGINIPPFRGPGKFQEDLFLLFLPLNLLRQMQNPYPEP